MFRQWVAVLLVVLLVSGLGAGEGNITCQGGDRTHRSDMAWQVGRACGAQCRYRYLFVNNGNNTGLDGQN